MDVNNPLREALARVGGRDPLHVGVGPDELTVTTLDGAVVEKKVPLPDRWLRGFAEVQVIASGFDLRAELAGPQAVRFLRGLPKRAAAEVWAVPAGRELRLSERAVPGGVHLAGVGRLATMTPLLRFAKALRVYGPADGSGSSAWELELPGMRYTLVLSPQAWRGFSGEGAVLDDLSSDLVAGDADLVGILLDFEPTLELGVLAERSGLAPERVRASLTQLGTAGRVGYDLFEAAHFHRELPYDRDHVAALNPRLGSARALVASGAVRLTGPDSAEVTTGGGVRLVRMTEGGVHLPVVVRPPGLARPLQARARRPDGLRHRRLPGGTGPPSPGRTPDDGLGRGPEPRRERRPRRARGPDGGARRRGAQGGRQGAARISQAGASRGGDLRPVEKAGRTGRAPAGGGCGLARRRRRRGHLAEPPRTRDLPLGDAGRHRRPHPGDLRAGARVAGRPGQPARAPDPHLDLAGAAAGAGPAPRYRRDPARARPARAGLARHAAQRGRAPPGPAPRHPAAEDLRGAGCGPRPARGAERPAARRVLAQSPDRAER
ncbi:hypothetical protein [Streptosporangium vulgare]|uniref:hypothetical protein n=1 Tax=Streptosporangium vulgare TaxID=46190 RepID=UPI0031D8ECE7